MKSLLENQLRNFAALATGDRIKIQDDWENVYELKIFGVSAIEDEIELFDEELKAVDIIDCDLNVLFEKLDSRPKDGEEQSEEVEEDQGDQFFVQITIDMLLDLVEFVKKLDTLKKIFQTIRFSINRRKEFLITTGRSEL